MSNKYNEKQGTNMKNSERFPAPPFPHQKQPFPGLAGKMQPRPDHGEESYQGSGRLTDRRVLITGGDSGIGRAVAIAFAREGADVAINYLPEEEEDAREVVDLIQKAGRKAVALPGDIREETFCQHLVSQVVKTLGGSISWSITRVASNSVSRLRNLQLMPLMQHSRLMSTRYSGLLKRQFTIYLQGA